MLKTWLLIEEAEVDFEEGLNILTGETGAGKSILMGAVNLALGQKMSREIIREERFLRPGRAGISGEP